jgi:hypothetical protein
VSGLVVAPADLVLGWNWISRGSRAAACAVCSEVRCFRNVIYRAR